MKTAEDRAVYIEYLDDELDLVRRQMIRDGLIKKPDSGAKFFFWTMGMGFVLGVVASLALQGWTQ